MNHDVSLVLELLEQASDRLRFRLLVRNRSAVKLLLARPEIVGLRFGNKATRNESDWMTSMLVSATWAGFTIEPGGAKSFEYHVRPCAVDLPETNDLDASDYRRWCVELPAGDYLVWFHMKQTEDYFCCDSHYRYPDLLREAALDQAVVWNGEALSNRLHLVRTEGSHRLP